MSRPPLNITQLKSKLATALNTELDAHNWTQQQAAEQLGVRQARISELRNYDLEQLGVDRLLRYADALGLEIDIDIYRDRKLRRT